MSVTAEGCAQITGNRPHIAALATGHLKRHLIQAGPVDHQNFFNPEWACGNLHVLTVAGQLIGPLPVNFNCRKLWWDLHDIPHKRADGVFDCRICWA